MAIRHARTRRYSGVDLTHAQVDIEPRGLHLHGFHRPRDQPQGQTTSYDATPSIGATGMIVTASLTTGVARAAHGMTDYIRLIADTYSPKRDFPGWT
ncbi:hypothetical protein LY41_001780 [Prauserella halophila]|nr:hypothetical protein [Prauserella halophila]